MLDESHEQIKFGRSEIDQCAARGLEPPLSRIQTPTAELEYALGTYSWIETG